MMADETPAETLRRAAAKMRELASACARGPWHIVTHVGGLEICRNPGCFVEGAGPEDLGDPDTVYVANMPPRVALLIADSWDATAVEMDAYEATESPNGAEANTVWGTPDPVWTAMLGAARAYLGEASGG